jgi:hypothetical protein
MNTTRTNHGANITLERIGDTFTLPQPPPGVEWHRKTGWTAEMLPPGTRSLCDGEACEQGDEVILPSQGRWSGIGLDFGAKMTARHLHTRTTRPLLFQHSGHEWTWHRAGDPMPCDGRAKVEILMQCGEKAGILTANSFEWGIDDIQPDGMVIGWRYADAEQPDPYAELKKAHAEGKLIQGCIRGHWIDCPHPSWKYPLYTYRIKPDDGPPWTEWPGGECPLKDEEVEEWEYKMRDGRTRKCDSPNTRRWEHPNGFKAYRVLKTRTPKPKVPLGPEDVPPGSIVTTARVKGRWASVVAVDDQGVLIASRVTERLIRVNYDKLRETRKINRSIPLTGKWNPDAWEACEK